MDVFTPEKRAEVNHGEEQDEDRKLRLNLAEVLLSAPDFQFPGGDVRLFYVAGFVEAHPGEREESERENRAMAAWCLSSVRVDTWRV
jgi:hypothetical protein